MTTPRPVAPRFNRRMAVRLGGGGIAASAFAGAGRGETAAQTASPAVERATPPSGTPPASGEAVPELAGFDKAMTALMTKWRLPGGQLAVARDGRLVFNRGYGWADVDGRVPVQPDALFRIASVTKPITAVAILTLVDAGKLSLNDKVFPLLAYAPPAHAPVDPRLDRITVKDLLVHAGGWDGSAGVDPQQLPWSRMAAAALGLADPAEAASLVRFMVGVSLDFDPGTKSVYSNFGFNVLGRVIEEVSGQPYADYVRDRVLAPAGITDMRLGRTRLVDRAPGEVLNYAPPGQAPFPSVFWGEGYVPAAYGAFYLESLDAHGGWIASASDLTRFATAIDGQRGRALLKPATVTAMITTPRPAVGAMGAGNAPAATGLGWDMAKVAGGVEWSHAGALIGSSVALLVRVPDGLTLAYVFNSQPEAADAFFPESYQALKTAASAIRTWPTHDLFMTQAAGAARPNDP